jgi:Ser/Thr protein kinase RdoA (MazF antagonist)
MKTFDQLSHHGRMRRLHNMAVAALPRFGMAGASCALLNASTNTLFDVRAGGRRLVLRIASPGWRTLTDLQSEAMWLEALARDTDLCTPRVIRSVHHEAVITMQTEGVPAACHVTLTTFLPGVLMGKRLTEANLKKMGALFARLHQHGKVWQPPAGFSSRTFEHFLSRGEPNALVDAPAILQQAINRVEAEYASLDRADLRVIHCDLWHDNIKVHRGSLCPFDFEDTIRGFRLHDIAMAMLDLREVMDEEKYARLLDCFREGYAANLDWPAGNLDALQAGRILWRMNFIKRNHPDSYEKQLPFHIALMQRFVDHDQLIAPLGP